MFCQLLLSNATSKMAAFVGVSRLTKKPLTGLLTQGPNCTRGMTKKPLTGLLTQGPYCTRGMTKKPLTGLCPTRGMAKKPQWPPAPWPEPPAKSTYKHLTNNERKDQGFPCHFDDPSLLYDEVHARTLIRAFNQAPVNQHERRAQILAELLNPKSSAKIHIEPPLYIDLGYNLTLGENVFINFDCILLDTAPISIGANVLIAPRVSIFTATHPLEPKARQQYALAKKVTIGNDSWIGGGAVIYPGVTIGSGVIVAAGAAVVKDVPDFCIVGGNPAQIIRYLPGAKEPSN